MEHAALCHEWRNYGMVNLLSALSPKAEEDNVHAAPINKTAR